MGHITILCRIFVGLSVFITMVVTFGEAREETLSLTISVVKGVKNSR